jgi:hypothetical protein
MNYITLEDGKAYYIDVSEIINFCASSENDRIGQTEVTELFTDSFSGLELKQRQISETKINNKATSSSDNYKLQIIMNFIEVILNCGKRPENGKVENFRDLGELAINEVISWNTLIKFGFLKELKD